jgi:ribosomal protein L21E
MRSQCRESSPSAIMPARLIWEAAQGMVVVCVAAPFSQQTNMPAKCFVGVTAIVFGGQNMSYN